MEDHLMIVYLYFTQFFFTVLQISHLRLKPMQLPHLLEALMYKPDRTVFPPESCPQIFTAQKTTTMEPKDHGVGRCVSLYPP